MDASTNRRKRQQNVSSSVRYTTRPRKRQKISVACVGCRARKVRCDGQQPACGNCQQREQPGGPCTYVSDHLRFSAEREYVRQLEDKIRRLESIQRLDADLPSSPPRAEHNDTSLLQNTETPHGNHQARMQKTVESTGISSGLHRQDLPSYDDRNSQLLFDPSSRQLSEFTLSEHDMLQGSDPVSAMGVGSKVFDTATSTQGLFYGDSSTVSFQNQVLETIREPTSESNLLNNPRLPTGNEREYSVPRNLPIMRSCSRLEALSLPPRPLGDHLLNLYWSRIYPMYPFIHKPSFLSRYEQIWIGEIETDSGRNVDQSVGLGGSNCRPAIFVCALNAIFAIGCQLSDLPPEERESLVSTFALRNKHLLQTEILDGGNLALVQALLVTVQFLQSTHYPDQCWTTVGLACRAAQGIGLYQDESNNNRSALEIEVRRRTWYGCVILDMVMSMTLGRPPMIFSQTDVQLPTATNGDPFDPVSLTSTSNYINPPLGSFFIQAIKLNKILANVLMDVYKPRSSSCDKHHQTREYSINDEFEQIMKLDNALLDFESNVPDQLHWTRRNQSDGRTEITKLQVKVLQIRFLQLKLLLYRPIFSQLCTELKWGSTSKAFCISEFKTIANTMLYSGFARHCSITCIKAAEELIDVIHLASETLRTGVWWYDLFHLFSSAMILLLAESCPAIVQPTKFASIRQSWDKCLKLLERIGLHNDIVKQCNQTLQRTYQQIRANSHQKWLQNPITELINANVHPPLTIFPTSWEAAFQPSAYEWNDLQSTYDNEIMFTDIQNYDFPRMAGLENLRHMNDSVYSI